MLHVKQVIDVVTSWNPINHTQREEDENGNEEDTGHHLHRQGLRTHPREHGRHGKTGEAVRVRVECVRTVWVVDAKDYVKRDDMTLPKGYDMDAIEKLISRFIREAHEDARPGSWRMPPLSTAYLCDDGKMRTVGQMLEGISVELMPHDEVDFDLLLFSYGVDWTNPLVPTTHPAGLL